MPIRKIKQNLIYRFLNRIEISIRSNTCSNNSKNTTFNNDRFYKLIKYTLFIILFYYGYSYNILAYARTISFKKFDYPLYVANLSSLVDRVINENHGESRLSVIGQRFVGNVTPIDDFNFPFVLTPERLCKSEVDNEQDYIYLLILIKSRVENIAGREYIRKTWCQPNIADAFPIRCAFLLGVNHSDKALQQKIGQEAELHKDIIQGYFNDHYFNNTLKLVSGFKWATANCGEALYYGFVDDDFLVSPYNLISFLENNRKAATNDNKILGFVYSYAMPKRTNSKWYISIDEYPYMFWPEYCAAGAFFMRSDTLHRLEVGMRYTRSLRFDDVYLGIVAKRILIEFSNNSDKLLCEYTIAPNKLGNYVAIHTYGHLEKFHELWLEHVSRFT